jgi:hypothetical protein
VLTKKTAPVSRAAVPKIENGTGSSCRQANCVRLVKTMGDRKQQKPGATLAMIVDARRNLWIEILDTEKTHWRHSRLRCR